MLMRVLGSAAGGGFPQWNCGCPNCDAARTGTRPCAARTQSSLAVSDGYSWFLFNASPDLRQQIHASPAFWPPRPRANPFAAVLLTDGELDHTLGLPLLREGAELTLHCTHPVHDALSNTILRLMEPFCAVHWREVLPEQETRLGDHLTYRAFPAPTDKPGAAGRPRPPAAVIGYRITDRRTGHSLVYLPGTQTLSESIQAEMSQADCVLLDGTCWQDDDLARMGVIGKTARSMGHLPIAGPDGSLAYLASLPVTHRLYVHINNTNPILLDDSPERRRVEEHGIRVATDGMELEI